MPQYGYIVVEGPHDVEFVARVLKFYNLERIKNLSDLDPYWQRLVPTSFPVNDDLLRRVPIPLFLQNQTHSIAIHSAIGITRLIQSVEESVALLDLSRLTSVGIIADADTNKIPNDRFETISQDLDQIGIRAPERPGEVGTSSPRVGVFILPDNNSLGTLEDVLIECAEVIYPSLLQGSRTFIEGINIYSDEFVKKDRDDFCKPAGNNKAIVSCIASVLKPGKAIQVSIQDNRWLDNDVHVLPRVSLIISFLEHLLQLT